MKKLLSLLIVLSMTLGLFAVSLADTQETRLMNDPSLPVRPLAADAEAEEEEEAGEAAETEEAAEAEEAAEGYLAYIMYADAAWQNQYWGTDDSAVAAENAYVTGEGDYTVSLDFTGTETGAAEGLAFMALGINDAEAEKKLYLKINEILVNGEAVEAGKGYTSSDDGVVTRMNIYNEWVSALPADARSYDGDLTDCNWIIVDKAAFEKVNEVSVSFSVLETIPDTAYIMFADTAWTVQYWGSDDGSGVAAEDPEVKGEGTYTAKLDFTGTTLGAASGTAFAAVGVTNGENTHPGWFIDVTDVKINGESIPLIAKGFTTSDDGVTTRENLYNEWVADIPAEARTPDGDLSDVSAIIVDKAAFEVVETIEVTFDYIYGEPPVAEAEGPMTEEEAKALMAEGFNAYIGVQGKDTYVFRNAWNDSYGLNDTENPFFFRLTGWDENNNAVDYGGTFEDVKITADGDYTVSLTTGEMGFGATEAFNLLFVSTDIPSKLVNDGFLTIDNVRVKIGDAATKELTHVNTSGDYVQLYLVDTYNIGDAEFGYTVPGAGQTIAITFTVTGMPE